MNTIKNQAPLFREVVFGLEDSLVSTLGSVTGIAAGTGNKYVVLLAGTVYVVVEAMSMVAGSFLSSRTQKEVEKHEILAEKLRLEQKPWERSGELNSFLSQKGMSEVEKSELVRIITKHTTWMMEEIAIHKLGIPVKSGEKPFINSIYMGISYVLGGMIPILPYTFLSMPFAMPASIGFTIFATACMGVLKAKVGGTSVLKNVIEVAGISSIVTLIGYLLGQFLSRLGV